MKQGSLSVEDITLCAKFYEDALIEYWDTANIKLL